MKMYKDLYINTRTIIDTLGADSVQSLLITIIKMQEVLPHIRMEKLMVIANFIILMDSYQVEQDLQMEYKLMVL